jgi:hypothetical protein
MHLRSDEPKEQLPSKAQNKQDAEQSVKPRKAPNRAKRQTAQSAKPHKAPNRATCQRAQSAKACKARNKALNHTTKCQSAQCSGKQSATRRYIAPNRVATCKSSKPAPRAGQRCPRNEGACSIKYNHQCPRNEGAQQTGGSNCKCMAEPKNNAKEASAPHFGNEPGTIHN